MRRRILPLLATFALVACEGSDPPLSPAVDPAVAPSAQAAGGPQLEDVIVVFRDGVADPPGLAQALVNAHGGALRFAYRHAIKGFAAALPPQAIQALGNNPNVAYIEPDLTATLVTTTVPANSWGLDRVDQTALPLNGQYSYDQDGSGVWAYILDTGIRVTHDEFGSRAVHGWDFIDNDPVADDCHGHGTHVAGTVGGALYGVAKSVNLVAVRVLNCGGSGSYSGIIAAVDWVADDATTNNRLGVANMSIGGPASTALNTAIDNAVDDGVVFAVAAGNESTNACTRSPASAADALTAGSTTSSDSRSSFSNYGTCLDLFAPGSGITSAYHTSDQATATFSGTSMASPHVAGGAALYRQANPGDDAHAVNAAVAAAATPNVVSNPGTGSPNLLLYTLFGGGSPPPPPPPPDDIDVMVSHTVSASGGGKRKKGVADIRVQEAGDPPGPGVGGVTVSGTWSGDYNGPGQGVTDSNGDLTLQTPNIRDGSDFTFCIDSLTSPDINDQTGMNYCETVGGGGEPPPPPGADHPTDLSVKYRTNGAKANTMLTWTVGGEDKVDIWEDGAKIDSGVNNDGNWSKGWYGGTFTYQVCNAGLTAPPSPDECSNTAG